MAISLIIMALPVVIIYPLQMTLGRKAQAIGAFLFQLPLCGFAVVRLLHLRRAYRSDDLTWESVEWQIWTQVALHFTVVAKNMPCLKVFLEGMFLFQNCPCFQLPDIFVIQVSNLSSSDPAWVVPLAPRLSFVHILRVKAVGLRARKVAGIDADLQK